MYIQTHKCIHMQTQTRVGGGGGSIACHRKNYKYKHIHIHTGSLYLDPAKMAAILHLFKMFDFSFCVRLLEP